MKSKKKLFDLKLYQEGLRQLKTAGIISLIISLLCTVILPTGEYLSSKASYNEHLKNHLIGQYTKYTLSVSDAHIYYALFFLVVTPLMIFLLFRFLLKRDHSDFYHALPHSRKCIYFSFSAAAFTWIGIEVFGNTILSAILYTAFSKYITINIPGIFMFAGNIFITCLLIGSVLLFTLSLCGNIMTAIVVFLMLFFIPRILLSGYQLLLENLVPYLVLDEGFLSIRYNLFYDYFLAFINEEHANLSALGIPALYTLLLSIIFYISGIFSFTGRKSETAENSMTNPVMQAVFRTVFTMIICLIPLYILCVSNLHRNSNYYMEEPVMLYFYIVIFYIIAIAAMFLYELLTTRSLRNAVRCLKTLPFILVLNIVIFGGITLVLNTNLNRRMDADKISSISMFDSYNEYNPYSYRTTVYSFISHDYYDYTENDYFTYQLKQQKFDNKELVSFFCSLYNATADNYQDYLDGKNNNYYYHTGDEYATYTITFHGKGSSHTAQLNVNISDLEELLDIPEAKSIWRSVYTELPDLTKDDTISSDYFDDWSFSQSELTMLYDSYRKELKEMCDEDWPLLTSTGYNFALSVSIYKDDRYYNMMLPINSKTPKTYNKVFSLIYEKSESFEEFASYVDNYSKNVTYPYFSIGVYHPSDDDAMNRIYSDSTIDAAAYLKEVLNDASDTHGNFETDDYIITISTWNDNSPGPSYILKISKETFDALKKDYEF